MEEMELRNATINDTQDRVQTAEAKAHHYDATKFDRPSVTVDVVMMLRIQKERLEGLQVDVAAFVRGYQLNGERRAMARKELLVMHPGPMIRGLEITSDVADGLGSLITDQVRNGVFVRRAVLARALAGSS